MLDALIKKTFLRSNPRFIFLMLTRLSLERAFVGPKIYIGQGQVKPSVPLDNIYMGQGQVKPSVPLDNVAPLNDFSLHQYLTSLEPKDKLLASI